jgi:predicted O-methyltransferase YrrM
MGMVKPVNVLPTYYRIAPGICRSGLHTKNKDHILAMNQLKNLVYAGFDPLDLYRKYESELRVLARKLRMVFHVMQRQGHGTTFGDVEGELMYMLIRESRPDLVFEISPDCGWSTNYVLAALTENGNGILHSFELEPYKYRKPTETLIRSNQHRDWDQSRLITHLGDARQTVPIVEGKVGFLLIDSCHEDWFADWYIKSVFPRVHGVAFVQDIAFVDGLEPSTEAQYFWEWASQEHIELSLVGALETEPQLSNIRTGFAERRNLCSNSVVFAIPNTHSGLLPELIQSPEHLVEQAKIYAARAEQDVADKLVSEATALVLRSPTRVNRHRLLHKAGQIYLQLDMPDEAARLFQRALGVVVQVDLQQRVKGLAELFRLFMVERRWAHALQACLLLILARRDGVILLFRTVLSLIRATLHRARSRI